MENVVTLVKQVTSVTWDVVSLNVLSTPPHLASVVVLTPIPTLTIAVVAVTSVVAKSAVPAPNVSVQAISSIAMASVSIQRQIEAIVAVAVVSVLQVKSVVKVVVLQNVQVKPTQFVLVDVLKSKRLASTVVFVEMLVAKEKFALKESVVVPKEKPAVKKRVSTRPKIPITAEVAEFAVKAVSSALSTLLEKESVSRAVQQPLPTHATVVVSITKQTLKTVVDVVKPVLQSNLVKVASAPVQMERASVVETVSTPKKTISTVVSAETAVHKVNNASKANVN